MVVHGQGMDEISTLGITKIRQLTEGKITAMELDPADFGIASPFVDELQSGDVITNAAIIRDILAGTETGARKDIVVLNAAAAIIVAGLADSFESAIKLADESITSGQAMDRLEKLIKISNS